MGHIQLAKGDHVWSPAVTWLAVYPVRVVPGDAVYAISSFSSATLVFFGTPAVT